MPLSSTDLNAMPWSLMVADQNNAIRNKTDNQKINSNEKNAAFGEDGFTFADALDIINPLQHIPFIAPIYRQITGDTIDQGSKIAGATLFGGPVGFAAAMANNAIEQNTGKDIGENILAFFNNDDVEPIEKPAMIAKNPSEDIPPANQSIVTTSIINAANINAANINGNILQAAKQISSQIININDLKVKKTDDKKNNQTDNMEHNPNILSNSQIKAYMQDALIKYNQTYKLDS